MADGTIAVAVEKAVHDALRDLAQAVFNQHGICIKNVAFDWLDFSTYNTSKMIVSGVTAETVTSGIAGDKADGHGN